MSLPFGSRNLDRVSIAIRFRRKTEREGDKHESDRSFFFRGKNEDLAAYGFGVVPGSFHVGLPIA